MSALDFDHWRASYDEATFAEQQEFYDRVWELYPNQRHWSPEGAWLAFSAFTGQPLRVVELGGWDGALADLMLANFPRITSWTNLEISGKAARHPVCKDERFESVALEAHVWEDPSQSPDCDLMVATHTFEHLTLEHALAAVDAVDPSRALYVEIPIREFATDWSGYFGTHILEVGWIGLEAALLSRGYELSVGAGGTCRLYGRSDA